MACQDLRSTTYLLFVRKVGQTFRAGLHSIYSKQCLNRQILPILTVAFFLLQMQASNAQSPKTIFQWPLQQKAVPDLKGLTSTFAESRQDHFHNGIDISSINQAIKPVAAGKVVFSKHVQDDPFHPMAGPGNYLFIGHGQGYLSGYYHLKSDRPLKRSGIVQTDSTIAYTGNSGHSAGAHLHFFIAQKQGRIIINPLELLPKVSDPNPPIIGQLVIKTPKSKTLISYSRQENIRLSQAWPFQVIIIDPGLEKHSRRGIYELEWSVNGGSPHKRRFSRLQFEKGQWLLNKEFSFKDSFHHSLYNLGQLDLVQGNNTIVIKATDFSGNLSSQSYKLGVNKEY